MDKELAKKQKLNWQALLIEETQTELKKLIQDLVLSGASFGLIKKKVQELVKKCVDELELDSLKVVAERSLLTFAGRVYTITNRTFAGLTLRDVGVLSAVASGNTDYDKIKRVQEIMTRDVRHAYNWGVPLETYAKDYMKMIEQRVNDLAKLEAKEDYTTNVSLRNIAEIQVREEWREKELQDMVDKGVDLVWIVPHANCSERCQPFQGKLYSISGKYGEIDGIKYEPLTNATDIYETTKSGKVYKNGCLSGFNCRHTIKEYKDKNKPIEIPAEVVDKQREVNNKQRYLERGVRAWRDVAVQYKGLLGSGVKEIVTYTEKHPEGRTLNVKAKYVEARNKAIEWNRRYVDYSRTNNVPYYPDRVKII